MNPPPETPLTIVMWTRQAGNLERRAGLKDMMSTAIFNRPENRPELREVEYWLASVHGGPISVPPKSEKRG
jgi:hypothetical protein